MHPIAFASLAFRVIRSKGVLKQKVLNFVIAICVFTTYAILEPRPPAANQINPCVPSPCGANALCKERNNAGSCVCLPEFIGNPYEECRPECILNSDCPSNKACINQKCRDPCPGTCGQNADCQVINHLPSCTCIPGFTGDPFRYCNRIPPEEGELSVKTRTFL